MSYEFNANGTYSYTANFDIVISHQRITIHEKGTYSVQDDTLTLIENQRGRESFLDLQEEIEEVDGNAGGQTSCVVGSMGIQLTGNNPTQLGQQSAQSVCGGIGHE